MSTSNFYLISSDSFQFRSRGLWQVSALESHESSTLLLVDDVAKAQGNEPFEIKPHSFGLEKTIMRE